jgi:two-component system chemotaxis response regulator CheY
VRSFPLLPADRPEEKAVEILVVDDSTAMRMIVSRSVRLAGYEDATINEAANGAEAMAALRASSPNVVLCDWNMPVMSGIELLRALRRAGNRVPFGFVTSESSAEMREQAIGSGAAFLLAKPFSPEALGDALAAVV